MDVALRFAKMRDMLPLLLALAIAPTATVAESPRPAVKARAVAKKTKLSPQLVAVLAHLGEPVALTEPERAKLRRVVAAMPAPGTKVNLPKTWSSFVKSWHARHPTGDIHGVIQHVISASYLEQSEDLRHYAAKVRFFNEAKKRLRDQLKSQRKRAAALAPTAKLKLPKLTVRRKYAAGKSALAFGPKSAYTAAEANEILADWEDELATIGEDAQLANLDLQNALQKQQQTLQTMSNVSKMLHDTAMAVIKKMM